MTARHHALMAWRNFRLALRYWSGEPALSRHYALEYCREAWLMCRAHWRAFARWRGRG